MRGWVCLATFALVACGGDGEIGPDPDTVAPLSWDEGDLTALVMVERQHKDPLTLDVDRCGWYVQLGRATAAAEIPRTDQQGQCILTNADIELRGQPAQESFCGGTLRIAAGSLNQTLTVCGDTIPNRMELACDDVDASTNVTVLSRAAEVDGDLLGDAEITLERGRIPDVQAPEPQGDGTALWPVGELLVGWGGTGAASVEIVLRDRMGSGPIVRCFVDDDGSFVVPARFADLYRDQITSLEVARVTQSVTDIEGVSLRLSARTSDAIWLFP